MFTGTEHIKVCPVCDRPRGDSLKPEIAPAAAWSLICDNINKKRTPYQLNLGGTEINTDQLTVTIPIPFDLPDDGRLKEIPIDALFHGAALMALQLMTHYIKDDDYEEVFRHMSAIFLNND